MDKALQDIQAKLDQLYTQLEAVNVELDQYPTDELVERIKLLDTEIDLVIDQLLGVNIKLPVTKHKDDK